MSIVEILNPKEHFIRHDGLSNVTFDVNFSIFKKYVCRAGCKICYIQDDFLPKEAFKKYIPINSRVNTHSYADRVLNFISYFEMPSIIDDLRYIRDSHPEMYKFYLEYGSAFWLSSITDNALFRQLPIIENEIAFKGIREVSISEKFFYSVNIEKFFDALDRVTAKAKIWKIKVILFAGQGIEERVTRLKKWCEDNDCMLEKQFEHTVIADPSKKILLDIKNTRYSSDSTFSEERIYSESASDVFPIHSESLFLMYDDFYSELRSATRDDRSQAFANLSDFNDPYMFLAKVLEGKAADYYRYTTLMKNKDHDYYRYFDYVARNLIVNRYFNFLPRVVLRPSSLYYQKLLENGKLVDTQFGLIDTTSSKIIPPYTFKNEPNLL